MPLERMPVITENDVDKARRDQLLTLGAFVGQATLALSFLYRANAPGGIVGRKIGQLVTGFEVKPTPSGRASVRLPFLGAVGALAPAPVGFIPPEWEGLHPAVVRRTLGFGAGKKPLIFEPSAERVKVFEATIEAERIAARALNTEVLFGRASGHPFRDIPPGPINVTPDELRFLQSLPAGLTPAQRLIPQLEARRHELRVVNDLGPSPFAGLAALIDSLPDPVTSGPGVTAGNVPSASVRPELIQPVNAAALANQAAAEGIRAALVHERADP